MQVPILRSSPRSFARFACCASLIWFLAGGSYNTQIEAATADAPAAEAVEFFEQSVRPLLIANCQACHGAKKQESGLRLDSRAAALKGGDGGPAIVPGKPGESRLIEAIGYAGDTQMPPKGKLPAESIASLRTWIEHGAVWPQDDPGLAAAKNKPTDPDAIAAARQNHWAFKPVQSPPVPEVKNAAWAKSPIDRFILARLEASGLSPSPAADPRTLLRRATYDLIGLPPTIEEIAAFEQSAIRNPQSAFEDVVDRLLASPHYGERWGRYWLDIARYADTKGYVFQEERKYPFAYTYRDYVINAFNSDKPYDQFLREQIAADKLDLVGDKGPLAAMGFLTLGRRFLNNQQDIIDDRIDVLMRGTQGLTVACARCHDHKFDPIPTQDYYSLYGVFASSMEPPELPLLAEVERTPELQKFEAELEKLRGVVTKFLDEQRVSVAVKLRSDAGKYLWAAHEARNKNEADRRNFARGENLRESVIERCQRMLAGRSKGHDPLFAAWLEFTQLDEKQFAAQAAPLAERIAANADENKPHNPLVAQAFAGPPPKSLQEVSDRYGQLFHRAATVGRAEPGAPDAASSDDSLEPFRELLYAENSPFHVSPDSVESVLDRPDRNKLRELRKKVDEFQAKNPAAPPRAMVLVDRPQMVEPRVLNRGNVRNQGEQVPRQFLTVVAGDARQPFKQGSGRLELAQAIASRDNPLTARVMVNRIWMQHFGAPLVRTPSDFGSRSEPPTHPELLDYLAWQFMERGWSIKQMHREMLLSAAYQQSSDLRADCAALDPENRLLWRMNRRRLDFEALRDSLLAASGKLDPAVGGKSFDLMSEPFGTRRTMYGFIDRQNLQSIFRTFDFASPDATSPGRHSTTIPQQSLFLLNGPFVIEQARAVAASSSTLRVEPPQVTGATEAQSRVRQVYRTVLRREPDTEEVRLAMAYLDQEASGGNASVASTVWQYGYGRVVGPAEDRQTGGLPHETRQTGGSAHVAEFTALPHWTGKAWQGGPNLPDPKTGWVLLTGTGGHAGNDHEQCTVRRWTSPLEGVVNVSGILSHGSDQGDGVRARIVSSRSGIVGQWDVHKSSAPARVEKFEVQRGDTLDFVVDCRGNPNNDSFVWAPVIQVASKASQGNSTSAAAPIEWSASKDFSGPTPARVGPWEKLAQVLLLSNEFAFVD